MANFRKQKQYLKRKKVCTQIRGKKILTLRQKPKDPKHKSNPKNLNQNQTNQNTQN